MIPLIAGAMVGIGQAGAQLQKDWSNENIEKMREEAMAARQAALVEAQKSMQKAGFTHAEGIQEKGQKFTSGENLLGREHQTTLQGQQQTFTAGENVLNRTQQAALQSAQQEFLREQNALQRDLTREQIASQERLSKSNHAIALEVAKIGGTVQPDKDGNMLFFDKSGKATPIMDPSKPGEPLKGYKDLTPAAKAYAEVIKAQLVGLNAQETAAMGDQTAIAAITQKRAALNANLLNVLTGGIEGAGKGGNQASAPSEVDINMLRKNPTAKTLFDKKFGEGAADKYLSTGEPQAKGTPLADYPPGTPKEGGKMPNRGSLIQGRANIAAQTEQEKADDEERRQGLINKGVGYGIGY